MREKYWKDVYQCRFFILEALRKKGFFFEEVNVQELILPFQNRIKGNGAIGIACNSQELPISLFTPYGELNFIKRKIGFLSYSKESANELMEELKKQLGLVQAEESTEKGETIKVFYVTKLPWSKRKKDLPCLIREKEESQSYGDAVTAIRRVEKIHRMLPQLIKND